MLNSSDIISTLKSRMPELAERFYIDRIGIFGSYARDKQTESSDIDFVVKFKDDCDDLFSTKYDLREFLFSLFGKEVDIANIEYLKPYILKDILAEIKYVG